MKSPSQISCTCRPWGLTNCPCQRILHFLQALNVQLAGAIQQVVTIVKPGSNYTDSDGLSSIGCQHRSNVSKILLALRLPLPSSASPLLRKNVFYPHIKPTWGTSARCNTFITMLCSATKWIICRISWVC